MVAHERMKIFQEENALVGSGQDLIECGDRVARADVAAEAPGDGPLDQFLSTALADLAQCLLDPTLLPRDHVQDWVASPNQCLQFLIDFGTHPCRCHAPPPLCPLKISTSMSVAVGKCS